VGGFPRWCLGGLAVGDPSADSVRHALSWGDQRVLRAEVLAALLLGAGEVEPGRVPVLRLRGVRVTGRLDLMGATVCCPLVCEYCWFDEQLRFVESSVKTVRIVASRLPGFDGARMRLGGRLDLSSSSADSMITLVQAKVSGLLSLRDGPRNRASVRRGDPV